MDGQYHGASFPINNKANKIKTKAKDNKMSLLIFLATTNVQRIIPAHKIRAKFAILLPIIFAKASCVCPWNADCIFTNNSGAEVPKATIVSPINISESLYFFANPLAQSIKKSDHFKSKINHNKRSRIGMSIRQYS